MSEITIQTEFQEGDMIHFIGNRAAPDSGRITGYYVKISSKAPEPYRVIVMYIIEDGQIITETGSYSTKEELVAHKTGQAYDRKAVKS